MAPPAYAGLGATFGNSQSNGGSLAEVRGWAAEFVSRHLVGAVDGASVRGSAQWALDVGPRLLATLDKRIERQGAC